MNTAMKQLLISAAILAMLSGCNRSDPAPDPVANDAPAAPAGPVDSVADVPPAVAAALETMDASSMPVNGGNCALDAVNGGPASEASVARGSDAMFGGWIGDSANQVPTDARLVFVGGTTAYSVPLAAGGERPDVAEALGSEALATSGFNLLVNLDVVPDTYSLSIVHGSGEAAAQCPLSPALVVTE